MLILSTQSILHFPKGFIIGYFESFCCWDAVQYRNLGNYRQAKESSPKTSHTK